MLDVLDIQQAREELPRRLYNVAQIYGMNLESTDPNIAFEAQRGLQILEGLHAHLAEASRNMGGFDSNERFLAAQYVLPALYTATQTLEGHAEGLRHGQVMGGLFSDFWNWVKGEPEAPAEPAITYGPTAPAVPSLWDRITGAAGSAADTASTAATVTKVLMWGGLILILMWGYKKVEK